MKLLDWAVAQDLRIESNSQPFITDNNNYIYHCKFKNGIEHPKSLDHNLMKIEGVVDTGLFIDMTSKVIIGTPKGTKIVE